MKEILILICLESQNPKTEKNFFKSIVDKNKEYIKIIYLDKQSKNTKELNDINYWKLNYLTENLNFEIDNFEIICFCDGDIDNNQINSIKCTKKLIEDFFNNKIISNKFNLELMYDENHSFEFFIWHITEKFDEEFYLSNKQNINYLRNKYVDDIVNIYKKYDNKITNVKKFKQNSNIIWRPIVEFNNNGNKDHIEICRNLLFKFPKEKRYSIYFVLIEKIVIAYDKLVKQYKQN